MRQEVKRKDNSVVVVVELVVVVVHEIELALKCDLLGLL